VADRKGGSPADLVASAAHAVGDLAQFGQEVGKQTLKRVLSKLPKP
jgi:hypothetical protein